MNIISKKTLSTTSIYKNHIDRVDYFDIFEMEFSKRVSIETIYKGMFSTVPIWIEKLMRVRNKVVSLFGLKVMEPNDEVALEIGQRVGMFHVYYVSETEVIVGENDRHLDFRVSVLQEHNIVTVSTFVKYHNWFGKFYMFLIKPFHKLTVQAMMKNYLKRINR